MGPGVPYAIAAKFAYPGRPVIALVGDGAFQMNGMNELLTVKRYMERLDDKRARLLRLQQPGPEPGHLGAARAGGRPEVPGHAVDPGLRLRRATPSCCGLKGIYCDDGDRCRRGVGRGARRRPARRARGRRSTPRSRRCRRTSAVEQAEKMAEAMVKGDPERTRRDGEVLARQARGVHRAPEAVVGDRRERVASSGSKSTRTRSRPTSRSRTGRSSGTRRRSSSSRSHAGGEDGPRLHVLRRGRGRRGLVPARRRSSRARMRWTCAPRGCA